MKNKGQASAEFERMAAELERIAKLVRERPAVNHHFAERIELLAKQMREESALPIPLRTIPKEDKTK
jgi:hypothetical protein